MDLRMPIRRKSDQMRMFWWHTRNADEQINKIRALYGLPAASGQIHCLEPNLGLSVQVTDAELEADYENFVVDIDSLAWKEMAYFRDLFPQP